MIQFDVKFEDDFKDLIKNTYSSNGIFKPDFMKNKMKYCSPDTIYGGRHESNRHFIYAYEGKKIVGILKIKIGGVDSCYNKGWCNWIDFITVDPEYKGKGIATTLLKNMFEYLKEKGEKHMLASGYSTDGYTYLRLKIRKMADEYQIAYKDKDQIEFE